MIGSQQMWRYIKLDNEPNIDILSNVYWSILLAIIYTNLCLLNVSDRMKRQVQVADVNIT